MVFDDCVINILRRHSDTRHIRKTAAGNVQHTGTGGSQPVIPMIVLDDLFNGRIKQTAFRFVELHPLIEEAKAVIGTDHQFSFMIHIQGTVIIHLACGKLCKLQAFR